MLREDRLDVLERRTEALAERLRRLEGRIDYGPTVTRTPAPAARVEAPPPAPLARVEAPPTVPVANERVPVGRPRPEARPAAARPRPAAPHREVAVEDLLGGRVLAWLGGIAVLVGIAFFFALAISHGWIGPPARALIAGAGALVLLAGGVWLHNHKGRTDAALAAVSTAVAGLFATVTVAAQVYHLLPAVVGLLLAAAVGVVALGDLPARAECPRARHRRLVLAGRPGPAHDRRDLARRTGRRARGRGTRGATARARLA